MIDNTFRFVQCKNLILYCDKYSKNLMVFMFFFYSEPEPNLDPSGLQNIGPESTGFINSDYQKLYNQHLKKVFIGIF